MSQITTRRLRKWATLGMTLVLAVSLVTWVVRRKERLPEEIRVATGANGGLYTELGRAIEGPLELRLERGVTLAETAGSKENLQMLIDGDVELAIAQGSAVRIEEHSVHQRDLVQIEDVSVITPLFREFIFVIVRKGTNIQSVGELKGKHVWLGHDQSGNFDAASMILGHVGLEVGDVYRADGDLLKSLKDDELTDAAIVTAGIQHPALQRLMSTDELSVRSRM